jgi:hypothetical protein
MPHTGVTLGPGTLKLGTTDPAATDFSCEVTGGTVTHTYTDVGDPVTFLCGDTRPATRTRQDGLSFEIENDLSSAGMYKFLLDHDLDTIFFEYVPNTESGATWDGSIVASLPEEIGSDQFGSPIVSSVAWQGVGTFNFTPATAPAEPGA